MSSSTQSGYQMTLLLATLLYLLNLHAAGTQVSAESAIPILNNVGAADTQSNPPTCPSCCPRAEIGPQGPSGIPGMPGPPGIPGNHGNNGNNGMPGHTGTKGDSGTRGLNGSKGERGYAGPRGVPGQIGEPGPPGTIAMAASSQPGIPGYTPLPREIKGSPGTAGPVGDPGIPGLPGVPGEKGEPGKTGIQGPPGSPASPAPAALTARASTVAPIPQSAFSAAQWLTQTARYGTVDIVFNYEFSNNGKDFNKDTGRFTCRINGTYFFTFNIYMDQVHPVITLVKNGDFQVSPNQASMSNTIILDLIEGDQVWLKLLRGSMLTGNRGRQTTFSGHLLFPHIG